jgi:hypothetical protein
MRNKCPPGVLCIENMTLFFIIFIVFIVIYFLFNILNKTNMNVYNLETSKTNCNNNFNKNNQGLFPKPSYSFSNVENDVLLNPYEAPLRDNRIFPDSGIEFQKKIPINIQTQSFDTNYRQVGILTRHGGDKETILPLMGRPLMTNRDKWNFYALSDKNNMIKLQISIANSGNYSSCKGQTYKNCMGTNGCNDLMNGDLVKVDGYNDLFKVTTYENDTPRYIPYI